MEGLDVLLGGAGLVGVEDPVRPQAGAGRALNVVVAGHRDEQRTAPRFPFEQGQQARQEAVEALVIARGAGPGEVAGEKEQVRRADPGQPGVEAALEVGFRVAAEPAGP